MHEWESLSHVRWDCKYHVVIVPNFCKRLLYGQVKKRAGEILRDLCRQGGVELLEGHLMPDHVHLCLSSSPKFSIVFVIEFLKGESTVRIHRGIGNRRFTGLHYSSRGYCEGTVGLDGATIRKYIRELEKPDSHPQSLFE